MAGKWVNRGQDIFPCDFYKTGNLQDGECRFKEIQTNNNLLTTRRNWQLQPLAEV